jgi:predicted RecB family nuclease
LNKEKERMEKEMINNEVVESFIQCKYKAFQKYVNESENKTEFVLLEFELYKLYKRNFYAKIRSKVAYNQFVEKFHFIKQSPPGKISYFIEPVFKSENFELGFDALEVIPQISPAKKISYIPISISPRERISKLEKLSLCIRSLIFEKKHDIPIEHNKIIYGRNLKSTKFALQTYAKDANKLLNELKKLVKNGDAPNFYQNNHCQICEFQGPCRKTLIKKDDLSLLARMSQKDILKNNNKGIFTINQLSYTFRPKKKRKNTSNETHRLEYALKALALREKKTYVIEIPKLTCSKVAI